MKKAITLYIKRFVALLRSHFWLVLFGLSSEIIYFFYLVHDFPITRYWPDLTDMGVISNFSHAGFLKFLLLFAALFGLYGLAWQQVRVSGYAATRFIILAFGFIFAATAVFVYPVTAIDIFVYIANSLVLVQHHANPLITAPAQFAGQDPLMDLAGGFEALPSPYGPLAMAVQALPTAIAGRNVLLTLILMKSFFSVLLLITAWLIYKILARMAPEFALAGMLALAWNPFVLFEYAANGHNDIMMIFLMVLAVYFLGKDDHLLALLCIVASALIKFASLPLIPLFFIYSIMHLVSKEKRLSYVIWGPIASVFFCIVCFLPFWAGPQTFLRVFNQTQDRLYSFPMFLSDLCVTVISFAEARWIGMALFGCCFIGGLLGLLGLWKEGRTLSGLLKASFLTLLGLLAFGVTYIQVWYIIWPIIFVLLLPGRRAFFVGGMLASMAICVELVHAYVWPWGAYANPDAFTIANSIVYLILFAPTLFYLVGSRLTQIFSISRSPSRLL